MRSQPWCPPRAVAVLAAGLAVLSWACAARTSGGPVVTPDGVRFVLDRPAARTVALAGSFNGWSPTSHPLAGRPRKPWVVVVRLSPGEHLFMFVVDGVWLTPPAAEDYVDDGFGARNGVVVVER